MKVGTDGVLLGAWATANQTSGNLLDIGCGSGLISLMLAQRFPEATIDAIDLDEGAYIQTKENASLSAFEQRIQVFHQSLNAYAATCTKTYDLIVSNPPYFINSLKAPDLKRNLARHTDSLSVDDLIHDSAPLLKPNGKLALVLPYEQMSALETAIARENLFFQRITAVIPVVGGAPKRLLAEIGREKLTQPEVSELTIEISRHQYTEDYINLTKDFYLKM